MKAKDFVETNKERGRTEILFVGETGTDLIVFSGGPKEARQYRRWFEEKLDAILAVHTMKSAPTKARGG